MTDAVPGLYCHIPFCRTRCAYCDFYSVTAIARIDEYLAALAREIEMYRPEFARFDTIYLGGGTPSLLDVSRIAGLLEAIHRAFTILPGVEITIEVNPADWAADTLTELRRLGINRLTIGVQSLDDAELRLLGRRHTRDQALQAVQDAVAAGFDNIGLDLIYNLPGQAWSTWEDTLQQAVRLAPAHLSCYELELKPQTPLGQRAAAGAFPARTEEDERTFFLRTAEILEASGYIQYEVSNFARRLELASRHNQKYWDHTPYLGLGPAAHSFQAGRRWWNHASLADYLHDLAQGRPPIQASEQLGADALCLEDIFLGLRTRAGVDLERLKRLYGRDLLREHARVLEEYRRNGLIEISDGRLRPTRAGMAVADGLAVM